MESYKEKSRGLENMGMEHWYLENSVWVIFSEGPWGEHYEVVGRFASGYN